jgi:hypothetical protein
MINVNKKYWANFSDEELDEYAHEIFDYYRNKGFPYFPVENGYRGNEYRKLQKFQYNNVIDVKNKIITQTMHGLGLAWSYMPHSFEVQCNNMKTPVEVFNNDQDFLKVIYKRLKHGDNMSDNGIRKTIKIFTGTQAVSNFRPSAAAAIYDMFCGTKNKSVVWDMSSGFGGRLLGASLVKNLHYIGTDPSTKTFSGLVEMNDQLWLDGELYMLGSEEFRPDKNSLDFCFTSPPYFDTEKYAHETTQSYLKYTTKNLWVNGFLHDTMTNAYFGLKPGRIMAINIANVKSFPDIEQKTIATAKSVGFTLVETWKLALSKINSTGYKYEPIFIFKK